MSANNFAFTFYRVRNALVIAVALCNTSLLAEEQSPADANSPEHASKASLVNMPLTARLVRGEASMLPVADEPPAKLFVDPPLPRVLKRGMVLMQFRTENVQVVPVFGPDASKVSPRLGHLHIRVDDNPWVWAHTSVDDLIINRLTAGPHKIHIELADANHQILAKEVVQVEVPQGPHTAAFPHEHDLVSHLDSKDQSPAKLVVDPPPPDRLARGVAFIQYRTENAQIAPVFGTAALDVSPRICHLHITVDGARWRWAHTSSGPVILAGLTPGPHKVLIELVNANHKPIANNLVSFEVPQRSGE